MMKRGAYIIILYLILLLCVKEIRGDGKEQDGEDGTTENIERVEKECDGVPLCQEKLNDTHSDMGKLKEAIDIGNAVGELIREAVKKGQMKNFALKMAKIAGNFGKALPIIGPLVALVTGFLPSTESQQIGRLRVIIQHGFTVINNKLDNVYNKIDRVEIICKSEAYKTRVHDDKNTIINARATVRRWIEKSVTEKDLEGYTNAVKIMNGADINDAAANLKRSITNGDFTNAIIHAENSNRANINAKLLQIYALIYAGADAYLVWMKVKGKDDTAYNDQYIKSETVRWGKELVEISKTIIQFDKETFTDNWKTNFKKDYERIAGAGGSPEALVDTLQTFLEGKYDWQHTFAIVLKDSDWTTDRNWRRCESQTYAEANFKDTGKTFVVGHRDRSASFDFDRAMKDLRNFHTVYQWVTIFTYRNYKTAREVWDTNNQTEGMCTDFLIKGVINSDVEFHVRSSLGCAVRRNIGNLGWTFFKL